MKNAELGGDLQGLVFHFTLRDGETLPYTWRGVAFRNCIFSALSKWGDGMINRPIPRDWLRSSFGDGSVKAVYGDLPPHWPAWKMSRNVFESEYLKWRKDPANYTPPPKPDDDATA